MDAHNVRRRYVPNAHNQKYERVPTDSSIKKTSHSQHPEGFKSLGIRTPGDLNTTYEYQACQYKIKTFTRCLKACPMKKNEAWLAYTQYFLPSITYGSFTHSFTEKQYQHLRAQLLPTLLPKLGFPRTTHREVVFGPRESGGLGIKDLGAISIQHKEK